MSLQTTLIFNLSFMKDRMCAITSTVHPLPNIRYCCVSLHSHLYQSGIVCNRAHSVGVRRLIIVSICTHGCVLPSFLALAINVHDLSVFILRKCLPPNPHIVSETTIRLPRYHFGQNKLHHSFLILTKHFYYYFIFRVSIIRMHISKVNDGKII